MEDEMEIVDEMGKEVVVRKAPWWKSTIFISEIRFLAKFLLEVEIGDGDTKKWERNRTIFLLLVREQIKTRCDWWWVI